MPDAAVVDGEDLVRADLDLVAVEHRGGVGAEPHAVDEQVHPRAGRANGGGPLGGAQEDGMARLHAFAFEDDGGARRRSYDRLTGGHGDSRAADLEVHHRSDPEDKSWSPTNVPRGL